MSMSLVGVVVFIRFLLEACQMATSHVLLWAPPGCCCTNGWAKNLMVLCSVIKPRRARKEVKGCVWGVLCTSLS
eukprot:1427669-Amphidinium_carterae.1